MFWEIFKAHDYGIWPAELENILQDHQAIRNACVVNVFDEDAVTDLAAAVIEKNDRYTITEKEVYALISGKIYKQTNIWIYKCRFICRYRSLFTCRQIGMV